MNDGFDPRRSEEILRQALSDTLADMVFLDALPVDALPREDAAGQTRVAIDILKPASCRLEIEAPNSFRALIADVLFPSGAEKDAQDDAFLEILNVVTGKFLTAYFGAGAEIKLELPRFLFLDEEDEGRTISAICLEVEGNRLSAVLSSVRYRY